MSARETLLHAMLPAPGDGLPALADLDLDAFWFTFDAAAPWHLRWGLTAAGLVVGVGLAIAWTGRPLSRLTPERRDAVLQRAAASPVFGPLLDVVRIVAGFAYFDDPHVQDVVRGRA